MLLTSLPLSLQVCRAIAQLGIELNLMLSSLSAFGLVSAPYLDRAQSPRVSVSQSEIVTCFVSCHC